MAKKYGSTPQEHRDDMAMLNDFAALSPAKKEVFIAACEPHLAAALRNWMEKRPAKAVPAPEATERPPRQTIQHELITLDFHEYGIERKLTELLEMAKKGEINGLIFSARMTHKGGEPYLHGCEGRLLDNRAEAIGAAVLLQNSLV